MIEAILHLVEAIGDLSCDVHVHADACDESRGSDVNTRDLSLFERI